MVHSKPFRSIAAAAVTVGVLFGATSCGTPQTLQPYTQAEGVNYDAPMSGQQVPLKIRNLLIVSKQKGQGMLSGAVVATEDTKLTKVEGQTTNASGAPGAPIAPVTADVALKANEMTVLTEGKAIQLSSADLTPGLTARLTLTFEKGGPVQITVPVVDGQKADYKTLAPAGAGGASGSASPATGSASPAAGQTPVAGQTPAAPGAPAPTPTS